MTYLQTVKSIFSVVIENIDSEAFDKYKSMSIDERLWTNMKLFNYTNIVKHLIEQNKSYKELIIELTNVNVELINKKIPTLNMYHVHNSYKELINGS